MQEVLARSIQDHEAAQTLKSPIFFGRGFPEWLRLLGVGATPLHMAAAQCRYACTVFLAEPWPEIYVRDRERHASFEQAARSYESTVSAYVESGYGTCVIPKASVRERVAFVLARISG